MAGSLAVRQILEKVSNTDTTSLFSSNTKHVDLKQAVLHKSRFVKQRAVKHYKIYIQSQTFYSNIVKDHRVFAENLAPHSSAEEQTYRQVAYLFDVLGIGNLVSLPINR